MGTYKEKLCKLTIGETLVTEEVLARREVNLGASALDPRTRALIELAALIALDADQLLYLSPVEEASSAGASADEIVDCLVAVLPAVGAARAASAAPKLGLALGYDVEAALERLDAPRP